MTYTDFLGNPIAVGDMIVYPACSGSTAADLNLGQVTEILDLIPKNPSDPNDTKAYLQIDLNKQNPPSRRICTRFIPDDPQPADAHRWYRKGTSERDDSKAYVLRVRKIRSGYTSEYIEQDRASMVKNVDRVVVVTGRVNNLV